MSGYHWTSRPPGNGRKFPGRRQVIGSPSARSDGGAEDSVLNSLKQGPSVLTARSVEPMDEEESAWRLRDRMQVLEQYSMGFSDCRSSRAVQPKPFQQPWLANSDEIKPTLSLEEHKQILESTVNAQTSRLTKEFSRRFKEIRAAHEHEMHRLNKEHQSAVQRLSVEINRSVAREGALKTELANKLQDLVVLSQAYENLLKEVKGNFDDAGGDD